MHARQSRKTSSRLYSQASSRMPYIKRIVSLQLEHFSSQNMDAQCLLMSGCSKCLPSQHTQTHRCTAAWRAPLMYIPKLCCMQAHPGACQRCKMPCERDPGCGRARCGRPAPGAQQSARCRRTKPILPGAAAARAHSRASSAPNGMAAGACRWLSRAMLTNTSACSSSMYASAPARAHLRTARAPMRCPLCSPAAQGEPGAALDIARSSRLRDCSEAAQWQARTRQPGVCKACAGKEHWPLKCPRRRDAVVGAPGSHARCARAGAGA